MARLDRFGSVKEMAQIGAAIGRRYQLTESGLAFRHGTIPEAVYTFKHALVQDVAHDSPLKTNDRSYTARLRERSRSSSRA
jgi:hypothetical protein